MRTAVHSAVALSDMPLQIVVLFDDDPLGYRMAPDWPYVHKVLAEPRHYYVRAANKLFQIVEDLKPDTDWFFFTHDDVEFVRPGWGPLTIGAYEQVLPDGGILECFGLGLCSHYLTKRSFIRDNFGGRLADTRYTNYYSDSHMLNECAQMGKYATVKLDSARAILNHQTTATRDAPSWEVQEAWFQDDQEIYKAAWPDFGKELQKKWVVVSINDGGVQEDEEPEQSL